MRLNDFKKLKMPKVVKSNNASKYGYLDIIITADTETSKQVYYTDDMKISPMSYGWVYEWAINCGGALFHGRTPIEFCDTLKKICELFQVNNKKKLVVYFHNLSYDYAYLNLFLAGTFGAVKFMLGDSAHKVFNIEYSNGLILRDSFKLVNTSLSKWCKNLYLPKIYSKASPIDYDIIRHQDTPLTKKDIHYMLMDVISLYKCIETYMIDGGYNIATIPITQTGRVRNYVRKKYKKSIKEMTRFKNSAYGAETYAHLSRLMSGGLTHGNRDLLGKTIVCYRNIEELERLKKHYGSSAVYIQGVIKHFDFRSDYPSQQRTELFPKDVKKLNINTMSDLKKHILNVRSTRKTTYSFDIRIKNIVVKKGVSLPYLQFSKCENKKGFIPYTILDNGRVLKYEGVFTITITLDEFKLIQKQYNVEQFRILNIYEYTLDYLPAFMRESIDDFFFDKTKYKSLAHKLEKELGKDNEETIDALKTLLRSKECLNSIYGMTASAYIHNNIVFDEELNVWKVTPPTNIEELLQKYYENKNNFARLEWGVFTTMWARLELIKFYEVIEKKGGEFLYADTDSIFYIDTVENACEKEIDVINERLRERSDRLGAFIEYDGKRVHYNQFENEKEDIECFRFLHAKCYIYIEKSGQKNITIAGVSGNNVDKWKALGKNINNLKKGFVINGKCAGLLTTYCNHDIGEDSHGNIYGNSALLTPRAYTLKDCDIDDDFINIYY